MIDYMIMGVSVLAWLAILCIVVALSALIVYIGVQDSCIVPRDRRGRFAARTTINKLRSFFRGI